MVKKALDITKKYAVTLQKDRTVLGILIFGSLVRGHFDQYSDIDLYVLCSKQPKFSRKGATDNNMKFDIILDGKREAYNFLRSERFSVRRNFSHMIAHGKIIFDAKGEMKKLKNLALKNLKEKTRITNDERLMHLYSINDFYGEVLRYSVKDDIVAFRQNCELLINNSIEFFLKLKGEFFRRPNEMSVLLKKKDELFGKKITKYYKAKNKKETITIITSLLKSIHQLAHGSLPRSWKVK